ncbi:hypothetical protein X777_07972, partial [Ooceraea biroi]
INTEILGEIFPTHRKYRNLPKQERNGEAKEPRLEKRTGCNERLIRSARGEYRNLAHNDV